MNRRVHLESLIREKYQREKRHEQILQITNDPVEILRTGRSIEEQMITIRGFVDEYLTLTSALDPSIPSDVAQIVQIVETTP